jgi:hypothetical protein
MSRAGNLTRASTVGGEHSRKELFEQLVDSFSEHLHILKKSPKIREVIKNLVYVLQKLISFRNFRNKLQVCRPTLLIQNRIRIWIRSGNRLKSRIREIISVPQHCLTLQKCTFSQLGIVALERVGSPEPEIKCHLPDPYRIRIRIR